MILSIRALPGFGPALADGLRGIVGSEAVAALEEVSAGVEDRVRLTVDNSQARGLSELTPPELSALDQGAPVPLGEPTFRPRSVGAMFPDLASPEDGQMESRASRVSRRHADLPHPRASRSAARVRRTVRVRRRGDSTNWGATIDGKTVIRRSAIGLDRDRKTLFVGISNATTVRALAAGMLHVGAHDVAQLDVNHTFPKFVLDARDAAGALTAFSAVKGFAVEPDAYVGRPSTRDFFYVTARRR